MATRPATIRREQLLLAQHIREAMRVAGGGFAPDYVARFLRGTIIEPAENDVQEVVTLLEGLVDTARTRLQDAGIELQYDATVPVSRLSKRERDSAANLSMLLSGLSVALQVAGNDPAALSAGHEAIAWAKRAGDFAQQAIAWRALGISHDRAGRRKEMYTAISGELEAAHASSSPWLLAKAFENQVTMLVSQRRYNDAKQAIAEALEFIETNVPEEDRHPVQAVLIMRSGQTALECDEVAEGIRLMREALHLTDAALFPLTRSVILSRITDAYLNLAQYRQCIECQHEVVQLAEAVGSNFIRAWGYFRLAYTHGLLKEHDHVIELLDLSDAYAPAGVLELKVAIARQRATILTEIGDLDTAAGLCRWIIETIGDQPIPHSVLNALSTLGKIAMKRGRPEEAGEFYRNAMEFAGRFLPTHTGQFKASLAEVLQHLGRYDESATLLDELPPNREIHLEYQAKAYHLRAAVAEHRGDMHAVVEYEREAFAMERILLERQAEQSLRNARVMAQVELLEREAELERERRRRAERELADAVVALGDRKRTATAVEQRLRTILARSIGSNERTVTNALQETLAELKSDGKAQGTPLHYLAGVDEDFYVRLRERFPNLTQKQERLCGLLRAGLASREIGTLMELEPEGLKALRKRLRRALGIDETERLEKLMAEI